MKQHPVTRYCAPPNVVRLLERDGLGWGHDLDCGALFVPTVPAEKETK